MGEKKEIQNIQENKWVQPSIVIEANTIMSWILAKHASILNTNICKGIACDHSWLGKIALWQSYILFIYILQCLGQYLRPFSC